jgi:hypothetical protein
MRAVQERFLVYARRDLSLLRRVLRRSSDAAHRALAAQILGYVQNKQAIVDDLVRAMRDPAGDVRNPAIRALAVFTLARPAPGRPAPRVPYEPFVELLSSPVWTDRNKSVTALADLLQARDRQPLERLRATALASLVEMARWKYAGHAAPALFLLARIASRPDADASEALTSGDRETLIAAALAARRR